MSQQERETEPGDVVSVQLDGHPAGYARIEEIRRHARPGWYECDLLFLGQPLQPVTWILEREQIDGTPFTMGGRPVQIERLPDPGQVRVAAQAPASEGAPPDAEPEPEPRAKPERKRGDNVVQLVRKPKSE